MKKIALFLSILFLASSVFSQGLLTFRQLNGDTFHLNIADIQLAFIYNGSSTKLIKSGKAGSIYTLDSLGYLKNNSCNSFIDVNVNPNGARLLISKNHIDNVLKFRNGARIILPDGSQVTTTTLWADVIAQTSVPVGCGAGVDSTGNVDHGNILYVATTGDNATAVKGNPHKPYLTIQGAIDSATAGDLIVVYPGTYTEATNVGAKSINQYYYSGAFCSGCFINSPSNTMLNISGDGGFSTTEHFIIADSSSVIKVEADSVYTDGNLIRDSNADILINVDKVEMALYQELTFCRASGVDTSKWYTFIINIKSLKSYALYYATPKRNVEMNIDYWNILNGDQHGIFSQWQTSNKDARVNVKINTIFDDMQGSPVTPQSQGFFYYDVTNTESSKDMSINVEIGQYKGARPLFAYINQAAGNNSDNSFYRIKCDNWVYTDTLSMFFAQKSAWPRSCRFPIYIEGNFTALNGTALTYDNSTTWNANLFFKDVSIKSASSSPALNFKAVGNEKLYFSNARLIVPNSSISAISATSASNIYSMNTYTNSLTVDPDVTEVIQPIVRNANIK